MRKYRSKIFENKGFSLIELLVAMFILSLITIAMVAVSVAAFRSYEKSRAIKIVSEEIGYALNSIAKDVRMGKVEPIPAYANGGLTRRFILTRNATQQKACYLISEDYKKLIVLEGTTDCNDGVQRVIIDLAGTDMSFDSLTGFRACPSASIANAASDPGYYACSPLATPELRRGWVEINLNIANPTMKTDSIFIQTIVSSRDYGWEVKTP